jgi:hypothetical protein
LIIALKMLDMPELQLSTAHGQMPTSIVDNWLSGNLLALGKTKSVEGGRKTKSGAVNMVRILTTP